MGKAISVKEIFKSDEVAAGGTLESPVINLEDYSLDGFMSLQLEITGNGILDADVMASNNGVDFVVLDDTDGNPIGENLDDTSGAGADGKVMLEIDLMLFKKMKILLTETSSANPATVSGWLAMS